MRFITVFIVILLLVSACGETIQKGAIDFSGAWSLNLENCDLGGPSGRERGPDQSGTPLPDRGDRPREGRRGGLGRGPSKIIVAQKDNELLVQTSFKNPEGEEFSMKSTYTLDGKKCKNDSNFGTRVSTARWSKDGKTLTIKSTMTVFREDREFNMESTEKWSLEDGKLVIETTRSTPMGERTTKVMYDKIEQ